MAFLHFPGVALAFCLLVFNPADRAAFQVPYGAPQVCSQPGEPSAALGRALAQHPLFLPSDQAYIYP